MHEVTIASSILDILCDHLTRHPNTVARSITILVGAFRNIEIETLQFAFDALKEERPGCSNCDLQVKTSHLLARCAQNNHLYEPTPEKNYRCECGAGMGSIVRGQELDVVNCTLQAIEEVQACTK